MKKILYFYGTLLLTLAQAFLWVCVALMIPSFTDGEVHGGDVVGLIIFALPLLITVYLDTVIRGFDEWFMILLAFLVSPIRFIFQIITIVMYHVGGNDEDFGKKGDYTYKFSSWTMYVLFGTDNLKGAGSYYSSYEPRAGTKKPKKKTQTPAPQPAATAASSNNPFAPRADGTYDSTAIMTALSKRFDEKRFNHIQKLKGDLEKATVFVFAFVNWNDGWQSFDKYFLSKKYHKTAYITHVYVDNVDFVCDPIWNEGGEPSIVGAAKLYLPKGTYRIKVRYQIEIPSTDFPGIGAPNKTITNVSQTDSVTVTVTDEGSPKFVGIFASIGCRYTSYVDRDSIQHVKDLNWSLTSVGKELTYDECYDYYNDHSSFRYLVNGAAANLSY